MVGLLKVPETFIHVLEVGETYEFEITNGVNFHVELINSSHFSNSSVMYLFHGYFGTILVTGDFRYDPSLFIDSPLTPYVEQQNTDKVIDICYLDNTYCSQAYESIPTKKEALLKLFSYFEENLKHNKKFLIKFNKFGNELALIELSKRFNCKILVSKERFMRYKMLLETESSELFTSKYDHGIFIEVEDVEDRRFSSTLVDKFGIKNICPIALTIDKIFKKTFNLPYTEHSSFDELTEFIRKLKPKSIIATVKSSSLFSSSKIDDMSCFDAYLKSEPILNAQDQFEMVKNSLNFKNDAIIDCVGRNKLVMSNLLSFDEISFLQSNKNEIPCYDNLNTSSEEELPNIKSNFESELNFQLNSVNENSLETFDEIEDLQFSKIVHDTKHNFKKISQNKSLLFKNEEPFKDFDSFRRFLDFKNNNKEELEDYVTKIMNL